MSAPQSLPSARTARLLACLTEVTVCLAACLAACSDQSPPPPAARFDRPNRVAFLCARDAEMLPLSACSAAPKDGDDPLALFALVTQSGRGEVAAVNLRTRRVIDTRREIPGFTYQPVGEAPVAVVVPAGHPSHTYVASFGSRDVRVVRTRTIVATVDEEPMAQTVALRLPETGERVSPTAMVLTPDERALVVGVPDAGRLLVLPLVRCAAGASDCEDGLIDEAAIRSVDLSASAGRIAELDAIEPARYQQLCGYQRPELPKITSPAIPDGALDATPRPSALAVDAYCAPDAACAPRILVADDALPLVHVLDVAVLLAGGDPVLAPLVTGVPTSAVAVTPHVPRAVGQAEGEGSTQYVYAVDATDGSVMVLEGGFVLEVNADPTLRSDRIALGSVRSTARALSVLTPTFDVNGQPHQYVSPGKSERYPLSNLSCYDEEHVLETPSRLRGVFLAVATSEGLIHVVDVHDMELLPETQGAGACRECPAGDAIPVVTRHHQRLETSFVPEPGEPTPAFMPELDRLRFVVDRLAFQVRIDGTTASPSAPGLACMTCSDGRVRVYPTTDPSKRSTEPLDAGLPDAGLDAGPDGAVAAELPEPEPESPIASDGGFDASAPVDDVVIESCPEDRPALVCANGDPWATPEEVFVAVYEGRLPGASAALGRFIPPSDADNRTGGLELLTELDACSHGVLGEEDMGLESGGCYAPRKPEETKPPDGDQVVLISRPLGASGLAERLKGRDDAERIRDRCTALAEALEDEELDARVAFEIRRAYEDRLVVHDALITPVGRVHRFEQLADCYESPLSFEVRSYRAFTVTGNGSGFAHRVRANAAGRCEVDPSGDAQQRGRARVGCTFTNHTVELRFGADGRNDERPPPRDTTFEIGLGSRARKLVFDATQAGFAPATVLATDLAFNPIDERLYLVDISDRGLLPIGVDPFPPVLSTRYQYR